MSLAYEQSWEQRASAFPISLTMPLRSGTYGAEQVVSWLANLLPENTPLRDRSAVEGLASGHCWSSHAPWPRYRRSLFDKQVDQSLPQQIATKSNADELHGNDWRQFASAVGLSPAVVTKRIRELSDRVASKLEEALGETERYPSFRRDFGANLVFLIRERCQRIGRQGVG
ncbi:HipA N-terminal domain-containing protein [Rhizobium etli]|uniref:HipA N-terminal domain-containing protein n=1 Tax=Rhizobium etli TaxID=29449 RepID=UPI001F2B09FB|nr:MULTISPECIES: HipA N-terminal domain-containing protein [Rhizobium]